MDASIYITYNHSNPEHIEERIALMLQTFASLYGFEVELPSRPESRFEDDDETKLRIKRSACVFVFSTTMLTARLKEEIQYANSVFKPIVVIYKAIQGKPLIFPVNAIMKEVFLDTMNTADALKEVADFIKSNHKRKLSKEVNAIVSLASVGMGLFVMALLQSDMNN